MKQALKYTFGTMLLAGLSVPAVAHRHGHERPYINHSAVWITGTYTETDNNAMSMGDQWFQQASNANAADAGRRTIFLDPDAKFDFAVGYSYHIPHSHSRFFITYDHYRADDENTSTGNMLNLGVPLVNFSPFNNNSAYGRVDQKSDELRIGFSHRMGMSPKFNVDLSAFFEWDDVERTLYETINTPTGGADFRTRTTHSEVEGWGPGVGVMTNLRPFCNLHWGFFVGLKTALIWADNDWDQIAFSATEPTFGGLLYNYTPESSNSMIGKLDIKFGIDYCTAIRSDLGHYLFEAELGMRYMNMFNAFKNGNTAFNQQSQFESVNDNAIFTGSAVDFSRVGPFLTFKIGGMGS